MADSYRSFRSFWNVFPPHAAREHEVWNRNECSWQGPFMHRSGAFLHTTGLRVCEDWKCIFSHVGCVTANKAHFCIYYIDGHKQIGGSYFHFKYFHHRLDVWVFRALLFQNRHLASITIATLHSVVFQLGGGEDDHGTVPSHLGAGRGPPGLM